ncbi:hypothetical protein [Aedoeadaptatus coxii]|uniref:hypothetical protein n=1 Tax=Aedoeadaptatus coxii TaxID=755172 RepID=UPI002AD3A21C|nr:hypothetical protein [Peptoniphilus coxii]
MNRKLRLFMLILMMTLFAHGTVYAADEKELGAEAAIKAETSVSPDQTKGKDEQSPIPTATEETKSATSPEKDIKPTEGEATSGETNAVDEAKAAEDHKGEDTKATTEEKTAAPLMERAATTPSESEKATENGTSGKNEGPAPVDPKPEAKEEKPIEDKNQVEPSDDLKKLGEQIKAEKNKEKKAELQKEYNEKYLKEVEAGAGRKLDKDIEDSLTEDKDIADYHKIKAKKEEIEEKRSQGKLTQEDIDDFNKLLGAFEPPRKLTDEEAKIANDLAEKPYINISDESSDYGKEKYAEYQKIKKALDEALDPNKDPITEERLKELGVTSLQELKDKFDNLNKEVLELIKSNDDTKKIVPAFGDKDGKPKVQIYPMGPNGLGKELDMGKEDYYIPDGTSLDLLVQVGKNNDGQDFTFTITPNRIGEPSGDVSAGENVVFLNGKPMTFNKENGTYSFKTDKDFGIGQMRVKIPASFGKLHEGFTLKIQAGDKTEITKKFLITKKGYKDFADTSGIGSDGKEKPKVEDAGEIQDGKVSEYTQKVFNILTLLEKSDAYIDKVIANSGNGKAIDLDHVKIQITLPKDREGKVAEFIQGEGLQFEKQKDGSYVLELEKKVFEGQLEEKDGKYYSKGTEITKAKDLKNALLIGKDGKTYVDETGEHEVTTTESLEGESYKVIGDVLYQGEKKLGTFKNNKFDAEVEEEGKKVKKTFELRGNKLLIYTDVKDVYEGHVANKGENKEAEPTVTPTSKGKQVTVKNTVDGKEKTSFGGTIVENPIFKKEGDSLKLFDGAKGYTGSEEALVDDQGKKYSKDITITEEDKKAGFKEIDGKKYKIVKNAVFKKGYIVEGLESKQGFVLLDKFGRPMENVTVTYDTVKKTYTFTKTSDTKTSEKDKKPPVTSDGDKIIVGDDGKQIYVDSTNHVVNGDYEAILGKYYYDGKKFVSADAEKIIGDKLYQDLKKIDLEKKISETYLKDGKQAVVPEETKRYYGSDQAEDYYTLNNRVYVKSTFNGKTIFISTDADEKGKADVLSSEPIEKIVQITKDEKEKVVDENNIFDAVKKSNFKLRFPGFVAGEHVVYNLNAKVQADYTTTDADGTSKKVSIFKNENGSQMAVGSDKVIDKYFTFNHKAEKKYKFFKKHPEDLDKVLDYNFINIFYRDGNDRERDEYIIDLLKKESDAKTDDAKAKIEKELNFLNLLRKELRKLSGNENADFAKDKDGKLIFIDTSIKEGKDNKLDLNRSFLWKVGFNNSNGALFPEDKDSEIVIEDYNMDNRLVYDEIIINDTRENWEKAQKAYEDAKKKLAEAQVALEKESNDSNKEAVKKAEEALKKVEFKGSKEYFFLDQVKRIFLGVNPSYTGYRFVPGGDNFVITRKDIQTALDSKGKIITKGDGENAITYQVTYDKTTAQIKIKVLNAFYKKAEGDKKATSPIQEAYAKNIGKLIEKAGELSKADSKDLNSKFEDLLKVTFDEKSDCFGVLKEKFEETLKRINKIEDSGERATALKELTENFTSELKKLQLEYLDPSKKEYGYDDMRFNALRIELEPGTVIGGAIDDTKTKQVGITSVIVPSVDIPFTDEFGNILTNKDMYLKKAVQDILKDKKFNDKVEESFDVKNWNKNDDSYKKVMAEAYRRVSALNDEAIKRDKENPLVKDLVKVEKDNEKKVGIEKYTIEDAKNFAYDEFLIGKKPMQDGNSNLVNPYWRKDKDGKIQDAEALMKVYIEQLNAKIEDFNEESFKKSKAYQELTNPKLELGIYYMHNKGYDRAYFANQAEYKLNKVNQGPGIFGHEDNWKNKVCYPGIGQCLENAGGDKFPPFHGNGKDGDGMKAEDKFTMTHEPSVFKPESESPKFNKSSDKTGPIDLSKEKNPKVNFDVTLKVDKSKLEDKLAADVITGGTTDLTQYNDRGYFVYKNSVIVDFLPDIFQLADGSVIKLEIDEKALQANGANADGKNIEALKKVKAEYVEDIYKYLETLPENKRKALEAAIKKAEAEGKLDRTKNKHAVLAWLPDFEAPHGSEKPQFTLKMQGLKVDLKQFKEYQDSKFTGEEYINHAVFDIFYANSPTTIKDGNTGNVDKYLRIYDKDGKIINKDKAEEWFRGNAKVKFGDIFDYKIRYKHVKPGYVKTNQSTNLDKEWKLEDLFGSEKFYHGLRPILRKLPKFEEGFIAEYQIKGKKNYLSEKDIQDKLAKKEITLGDIVGIKIHHENGFEIDDTKEFILPMMIPEVDAKIEDGKVVYIGTDGKKHELGKAKDFFNFKDYSKSELSASNKVDGSNTVTVYLEKKRFVKVFKEFLESDGTLMKEQRPEVRFTIYQTIKDPSGKVTRIRLKDQLVLNEGNSFEAMVKDLPLFKKEYVIDKDGKVRVRQTTYGYEVEEEALPGFTGRVWKLNPNDDGPGVVFKAENTRKPEIPPETPPEEPKTPPEEPKNPPEEPKTPPEKPNTPPETPETPDKPGKPNKPNRPNKPNKPGRPGLPKTGVADEGMLLLASGGLLLALLAYRRKYAVK